MVEQLTISVPDGALRLARIDHQYLLHLPIIQIIELSHSGFSSLYEIYQDLRRACSSYELMLCGINE